MIFRCLEQPGSPGQPEVTEMTNNTVTLNWDKPASDGGEKRSFVSTDWQDRSLCCRRSDHWLLD